MSYIPSRNVSVFPLAKDRQDDRSANLFYEDNIANIIRQLVDVKGFLITDESESDLFTVENGKLYLQAGKSLAFNIGGRFFQITTTEVNNGFEPLEIYSLSDSVPAIYANIIIDSNKEVHGQDSGDEYQGLIISNNTEGASYSLKLLNVTQQDGTFVVTFPQESFMKIKLKSFSKSINFIDGQR